MIKSFDLTQIFPKYILRDTGGMAMAKAIEAALHYFLTKSNEALDTIQDVDKMPEWRLDEMAWELNCLYDYEADIEAKRGWIRDAYGKNRIHGTAEGVRQYLESYFGRSKVEEFFDYGADPGLFRVIVLGEWSLANEQWIRSAVNRAKNVRSSLDRIIYEGEPETADLYPVTAVSGVSVFESAGWFRDTSEYRVRDLEYQTVSTLEKMTVDTVQAIEE